MQTTRRLEGLLQEHVIENHRSTDCQESVPRKLGNLTLSCHGNGKDEREKVWQEKENTEVYSSGQATVSVFSYWVKIALVLSLAAVWRMPVRENRKITVVSWHCHNKHCKHRALLPRENWSSQNSDLTNFPCFLTLRVAHLPPAAFLPVSKITVEICIENRIMTSLARYGAQYVTMAH